MKLWGGRFSDKQDEMAELFNSSIGFDKRLYAYDIAGSTAHAEMLGKKGIIPEEHSKSIVTALKQILDDIDGGKLDIDESYEDIHSFVEATLTERIGEAGKRLHTGRSRNDQVALDMRMFVKAEIGEVQSLISDLLTVLINSAKSNTATIMPGFTHLQKAQPITVAHHLLAYFQMFKRDYTRLTDCKERMDEMPLGSGALAATVYPIDREFVREKLGFSRITENSLDAVSDRDFCIELLSCFSIIMVHLSRFCEELILWSTEEFGFITIPDAYSTGSSIMPQKKNPDMAELIRGKTGRVFGGLTALLTVMKSLPLAYNKDMQEDKETVFDAVDTVKACVSIFTNMLANITFNEEKLLRSTKWGYINATDAADWLVKKGVTFREAHEIIGKLVVLASRNNAALEELSLDDFKSVSEHFDSDVFDTIAVKSCVNARNVPGGPAESAVLDAISKAERFLAK